MQESSCKGEKKDYSKRNRGDQFVPDFGVGSSGLLPLLRLVLCPGAKGWVGVADTPDWGATCERLF